MRRLAALAWLCAGCYSATSVKPPAPPAAVATRPPAVATPPAVEAPQPAASTVAPSVTTPVAPAAAASAQPVAAPPPTFVVRYACDDKYDGDATCRPAKTAWEIWLQGIDLSVAAANLLNHQGGGPSGAEWNPAAPLVVFVASRTEAGSARLKSSRATFTPAARHENYDVFVVPVAGWSAAARHARAADFPEGTPLAPLRVVELRAVGDGMAQRGLFAFSSGE